MYIHGTTCLEGPITKSRGWWTSEENLDVATAPATDEIRHDLVARVRQEIAAGTYDTAEKMEPALARMFQRLD